MGAGRVRALWLLPLALVVAGCRVGVSAADSERMTREFSEANLERTMKAQGKQEEFEEAKRRAEEYRRAGGEEERAPGRAPTQRP